MIDAAKTNNITELQRLVATGANINSTDANGMTVLMCAAENGHVETTQYLVKASAELEAKDENGGTALMWAAQNGHIETAQCLVTAGTELNAKNKHGKIALMLAAENGHVAVAQYLVTASAELNTKDKKGRTALMWAARNGHVETAQYLVTAGAKLEAKDKHGWTALTRAARSRHVAVAQYLVYSGNPWASSMRQIPNYDAAIVELLKQEGSTLHDLNGIRNDIAWLKATIQRQLLLSIVPLPAVMRSDALAARIKLLKARICGVVFPEDFTQSLSGMTLVKFNYIVALMRAAKIANIVHGVNSYFLLVYL